MPRERLEPSTAPAMPPMTAPPTALLVCCCWQAAWACAWSSYVWAKLTPGTAMAVVRTSAAVPAIKAPSASMERKVIETLPLGDRLAAQV